MTAAAPASSSRITTRPFGPGPLVLSGLAALACWAAYAVHALRIGEGPNLLWGCHMATLLIGLGQLGGWRGLNAMGFLWLCVGVPVWAVDIATGGDFTIASAVSHLGGLALGFVGSRAWGLPRGIWWRALSVLVALQQLTRFITPASANVNLAFSIWSGWENRFPSYRAYWAFIVGLNGATFLAAEALYNRAHDRA